MTLPATMFRSGAQPVAFWLNSAALYRLQGSQQPDAMVRALWYAHARRCIGEARRRRVAATLSEFATSPLARLAANLGGFEFNDGEGFAFEVPGSPRWIAWLVSTEYVERSPQSLTERCVLMIGPEDRDGSPDLRDGESHEGTASELFAKLADWLALERGDPCATFVDDDGADFLH